VSPDDTRAPAAGPTGVAYRKLLVPLDGSLIAQQVFLTAVQLARLFGAQIHLLHVLEIEPALPPAAHFVPDGLEAKLLSEGHAVLQRWMSSAADQVFGPPHVVVGDPWRRILDVAREIGADVIVIGSHRYRGVDRLLGTVSAKVVNHAGCDVLVVHHRSGTVPPG